MGSNLHRPWPQAWPLPAHSPVKRGTLEQLHTSAAVRAVMPMGARSVMMTSVADVVTWVGAALVGSGLMWLLGDLLFYGLLTPTKKSPARPGDVESRRFFAQLIKLQVVLIGFGAILLVIGLAMS